MSESGEGSSAANVTFKKVSKFAKVRRGITQRKRKASSSSSEDESAVVSLHRRGKRNPLVQSTSGAPKRAWDRDSGSEEGEEAERAALLDATAAFKSSGSAPGPSDQGATATNEMDTDLTTDAQAQFMRTQEVLKARAEGKESESVYRGMSTYGAKIKKDTAQGNAANGFIRKGPIRAPTNVRMSVRWDYAPDLCKDYKETGYCTFGDSCKFVHDRTDYKHGWELERDWASGRYGKDDEDPNKYLIADEEEELPFACFLCRESFNNPVVTKCGHYFCEKCALDNFRQTPKCYVCDKPTGGVFTPAKELAARLQGEETKKSRRAAVAKEDEDKDALSDDGKEEDEVEETEMETLPDPVPEGKEEESSDGSEEPEEEKA